MANAAGVWLDTVIVCTASGLMMLLSGCYNTQFGYIGGTGAMHDQMAQLAADGTYGVIFVQNACNSVEGAVNFLYAVVVERFRYDAGEARIYDGSGAAGLSYQNVSSQLFFHNIVFI